MFLLTHSEICFYSYYIDPVFGYSPQQELKYYKRLQCLFLQ